MNNNAEGLVKAAQSGGSDALEELIRAVQDDVFRFTKHICFDNADAEDIAQETLVSMAINIDGFRGDSKLSTWLYQIARRHCMKKHRLRVGEPEHFTSMDDVSQRDLSETTNAEQLVGTAQEYLRIRRALFSLPPEYREVIVFRDLQELSAKETAEILDTTVANVKTRLHRARKMLHDNVQQNQIPKRPGCPDILDVFSRFLEGELSDSVCAEMQSHVESCDLCAKECDSYSEILNVCRSDKCEAPTSLIERIKARLLVELVEDDVPEES